MKIFLRVTISIAILASIAAAGSTLSFGNQPKAHVVGQGNNLTLIEVFGRNKDLNVQNLKWFTPEEQATKFAHIFLVRDPDNLQTSEYKKVHKNDKISKGTKLDKRGTPYGLIFSQGPMDTSFLTFDSRTTARL